MLAVALALVAVAASPSPTIIDPTDGNHTECAMRRLGYERGLQLQPHRAPLIELFDALELNSLCGDSRPTRATRMYERVRSQAVDAFHVCASESTQLNGCHSDEADDVPCRSGASNFVLRWVMRLSYHATGRGGGAAGLPSQLGNALQL
jgi:hypothetical protein